MKRLIAIILLIPVVFGVLFAIDFLTGYTIHSNVSYDENNLMDVYMPKNAGEKCGAVIFIHGGSWSSGDKSEEDVRCRILANAGYIAATINYTLLSEDNKAEYTVDIVLDEIEAAILSLKSFAKERGVSVEKVGLSGYSAGAHLAMLSSYSRQDRPPVEIAFTSSMAGPCDISPEVWGDHSASVIGGWLGGIEIDETNPGSEEAREILAKISPITYVDENTPPTMFIHGGRDNVVPLSNAENLAARLSENGVSHDFTYLPSSDHSLLQNPIKHLQYYLMLIDYADRYLA